MGVANLNPKIQLHRQQVMLGNNNRLNFAHLQRQSNDNVHVVLKKSSNQTIVIVSKPQSQPLQQASVVFDENKADNTNMNFNSKWPLINCKYKYKPNSPEIEHNLLKY